MKTSRLDEAIAQTAYVLDCLRSLKTIWESGDCNNCGIKNKCEYVPYPGEQVRYNCPFYEDDTSVTVKN